MVAGTVFQFDPRNAVRQQVEQDESRRQREIQRAWAYYDGAMKEPLKVKPGDFNDNVRLEYPKVIIDTSVAFLFGDNVKFEAGDEQRQALVDATWGTEEQKMTTLNRMGVNGGVVGHCYVKLVPLESGETRLVVLDPANVDVDWAPDDFSNTLRYTVEWAGYDDLLQKAVAFRQVVEKVDPQADGPWHITDSRSVGGGQFVVTAEEDWDFPFAPIVDCQNLVTANEFYGAPDMSDTSLDLVDRINMAASNIQKILRYHAHPKVFIYGYSGQDIDMSVDKAVNFPSTDTQVGVLGMPTELTAAFEMYDRLVDTLLLVTRTPKAALGDEGFAATAASGLALKLGFMPLVEKTGVKRQSYGYLLNEVNQRIQAIAGLDVQEVELAWPSITPDDPMAEVQTALLKQQVGVSKKTTLAEMGYDPDVEMQQAADEGQAAMEAMQQQMNSGAFGSLVNEDAAGAQTRAAQMQKRAQTLGGK